MTECPWPLDIDQCCRDSGMDPESPEDAARISDVIQQVSEMMSRWSGYTFGGCRTDRPLNPCGECRSGCCASGDCIKLHSAAAVSEVRVYGEVVPGSDWHFDPVSATLCAVPPLLWPTRDARFEKDGALEVDVMVGEEPDAWALSVANELACELLLSCSGSTKCRLPKNATSVTSQGITINLRQDEIIYSIPSVISWVGSVNPHRATRPARIMSPETRSARSGYSRAPWSRR